MANTQVRRGSAVKNAVTAILAIVALLLLLEVAVRVYTGFFVARMMMLDGRLGWRHAINSTKTFVRTRD